MGNALCCQNDLGEVPQDMHDGHPKGDKGTHKHKHHQNQVRIPNQATPVDVVVHEGNPSLSTRANSLISTQKSKKRSHLQPSSHSSSPSSSPVPDFSSSQSTLPATTLSLDPTQQHQHQQHQHQHQQSTSHKSLGPTHSAKTTGHRALNGVHTRLDSAPDTAGSANADPGQKQHKKATLFTTPNKHRSSSHRRLAADGATSSNSQTSLSIERKMERDHVSPDFQWLEGRRYHNTPGASYLLPNDIDEVDRLQLQHFILRYAIQGNYKSPLDKSKVRAILDVGCGPGTWTMVKTNGHAWTRVSFCRKKKVRRVEQESCNSPALTLSLAFF
ncbi:unnamed protein product [Mortierella alpina]